MTANTISREVTIYWDNQANDGYAYSYRPAPGQGDVDEFKHIDSGAVGEQVSEPSEDALRAAVTEYGLDPADATEWAPSINDGYARFIVDVPAK